MPANGRVLTLIDRKSGAPLDSQGGNAGYRAVLGGGIPNDGGSPSGGILWANAQASNGAAIGGAAATAINNAWVATRAYNTSIGNPALGTGPPYRWSEKIRVQSVSDDASTQGQPTWLLSRPGITTKTNGSVTIAAPWLGSTYRTYWQNFLAALAAFVPSGETLSLANNDLLGEITFGLITTDESMLVTPFSLAQMGNPSNATLITTWQNLASDAMAAFPNTYVSFALNPASYGGNTTTNTLLSWYLANATYPKPGNNSGRANHVSGTSGIGVSGPFTGNDPFTGAPWYNSGAYSDGHGSTYTAMYETMYLQGPGKFANEVGGPGYPIANPFPFYEQTATLSGMGNTAADLARTLSYFACCGVEMVELPSGYDILLPAQLAPYSALMAANYSTPNPPAVVGGVLPWRAYRYNH